MTVDQLLATISSEELSEWQIVWTIRNEEHEEHMKELKNR
jgi:hypothetical protein